MIHLDIRNESSRTGLFRRDVLQRIALKVCESEDRAHPGQEISLLFCDDLFIAQLNRQYRNKRGPTDVLSFAQSEAEFHGSHVLGDIVISLETVQRNCDGDPAAMRAEVRLLFCHGLLHLLGYEHGTEETRGVMQTKQAQYLNITAEDAWRNRPAPSVRKPRKGA